MIPLISFCCYFNFYSDFLDEVTIYCRFALIQSSILLALILNYRKRRCKKRSAEYTSIGRTAPP